MKKIAGLVLFCILIAVILSFSSHSCSLCISTPFTYCKQDASHVQNQSLCSNTPTVEKNSCCPLDKQSASDDCQICSSHDQSTSTEKMVDTQIKSKFQFEGIIAQADSLPTIVTPEKNPTILKLRSSPLISSLTFLKTIRLLC